MKRIRIVGLCLVAAFALSATIASSSQAAGYYHCVAQKKGEYTNSTCTTKSVKAKKGKYELAEFASCVAQKKGEYTNNTCTTKSVKAKKGKYEKVAPITFTDKTGEAKLATPDLGPHDVECTASTSSGDITGSTTGTDQVEFTGCTLEGHSCESADLFGYGTNSGKAGVIDTDPLDTTLVGHGEKAGGYEHKEPASGEVWGEVVGTTSGYSSEFICNGEIILHTHGSVSGVSTPVNGAPSTSGTNTFGLGEGEQALLTEVFNGTEFIPSGGAPSTEETTATLTYSAPIVVKS